jgi:hypothetical protein
LPAVTAACAHGSSAPNSWWKAGTKSSVTKGNRGSMTDRAAVCTWAVGWLVPAATADRMDGTWGINGSPAQHSTAQPDAPTNKPCQHVS